ncbi:hypothetical protein KI387_023238, partial [Taxus chinensis]
SGDMQGDKRECSSTLQDVAPCIEFVQGAGTQPPEDCCTNCALAKPNDKRCLSILTKDSSDPDTGLLPFNQTRLIHMPTFCNVKAKLSDCIGILKLSPSSPDRKFYETGSSAASKSSSAIPTDRNWSHRLKPCVGFSGFVLRAAF